MRTKLCMLALVLLVVWGLKRHYADARADDLWWISASDRAAGGDRDRRRLCGGAGRRATSRASALFLIEKSCAGINFMIAAFGMVVLTLFRRVDSGVAGMSVLAAGLLASYGAAVLVNATRITIAMWLAAHPIASSTLTPADVHRLEGIAVYFSGLLLLYELIRRLERVASHSESQP